MPYRFGPAVGVATGTTQQVVTAACKGACGTRSAAPVDLVLLVDRTPSMDSTDIENARRAADSVRSSSSNNPAEQWIAMGLIGPASERTTSASRTTRSWAPIPTAPPTCGAGCRSPLSGIGAPLNQNYKNCRQRHGEALLLTSCFKASPGDVATDLADPFDMAIKTLPRGRSDATKGIILMTDGQPNHSNAHQPSCSSPSSVYDDEAKAAAAVAKSQGIEVFTIGFGLAPGEIHNVVRRHRLVDHRPGDAGAPAPRRHGQPRRRRQPGAGRRLLRRRRRERRRGPLLLHPEVAGASANLADLFKQAVNQLIGGTKLVQLPT